MLRALLPCLADKAGHKNKDAAEASALFLDKALDSLLGSPGGDSDASEGKVGAGDVEEMLGPLLIGLTQSLNGKSPPAKAAAKQSITRIQAALGGAKAFAAAVDAGVATLALSTPTNGPVPTALQVNYSIHVSFMHKIKGGFSGVMFKVG